MANFDNVQVSLLSENGQFEPLSQNPHELVVKAPAENIVLSFGSDKVKPIEINNDTETSRLGKQSIIVTNNQTSHCIQFTSVHALKSFQHHLKQQKNKKLSVFTERTDEASAVQYFQFYGYLSQQQNMMQDYIRTSTYQQAMLSNLSDFTDKIVLDVGAGSGILSFFAVQSGAKKVYAIEASSMAQHCEMLVAHNNLGDKIEVITGKVEEVDVPEKVDIIISEPMGYMLFNERMLESYLHAKKWLKPGGKMFPTQGDLHIAPFTDEALYNEQYSKANFWYQESFHGVNLTTLRNAAVLEYFKQPIVDTFDVRICLSKPHKYSVDFQKADETELHVIDIPLSFTLQTTGMIHGLAFWFDVGFFGSSNNVWLSTSPTEPLTHWYQVRCLLQTPVLVKQGQILTGRCVLRCNTRQSYDVDIEINIPGTNSKSINTLDLKNPFFRYTGQTPQPPPGSNGQSATDSYWNGTYTGQNNQYVNGFLNGQVDPSQLLTQGVIATNLIAVSTVAPINPGSIPSVGQTAVSSNSQRTSIGGGISPLNFAPQSVISGGTQHYPTSNQFMIGDYVMPGNVVTPNQNQAYYKTEQQVNQ